MSIGRNWTTEEETRRVMRGLTDDLESPAREHATSEAPIDRAAKETATHALECLPHPERETSSLVARSIVLSSTPCLSLIVEFLEEDEALTIVPKEKIANPQIQRAIIRSYISKNGQGSPLVALETAIHSKNNKMAITIVKSYFKELLLEDPELMYKATMILGLNEEFHIANQTLDSLLQRRDYHAELKDAFAGGSKEIFKTVWNSYLDSIASFVEVKHGRIALFDLWAQLSQAAREGTKEIFELMMNDVYPDNDFSSIIENPDQLKILIKIVEVGVKAGCTFSYDYYQKVVEAVSSNKDCQSEIAKGAEQIFLAAIKGKQNKIYDEIEKNSEFSRETYFKALKEAIEVDNQYVYNELAKDIEICSHDELVELLKAASFAGNFKVFELAYRFTSKFPSNELIIEFPLSIHSQLKKEEWIKILPSFASKGNKEVFDQVLRLFLNQFSRIELNHKFFRSTHTTRILEDVLVESILSAGHKGNIEILKHCVLLYEELQLDYYFYRAALRDSLGHSIKYGHDECAQYLIEKYDSRITLRLSGFSLEDWRVQCRIAIDQALELSMEFENERIFDLTADLPLEAKYLNVIRAFRNSSKQSVRFIHKVLEKIDLRERDLIELLEIAITRKDQKFIKLLFSVIKTPVCYVVEQLLMKDFDLIYTFHAKFQMLFHFLILNKKAEDIENLLKEITLLNGDIRFGFELAIKANQFDIAILFLKKAKLNSFEQLKILTEAAKNGNEKIVQFLRANGTLKEEDIQEASDELFFQTIMKEDDDEQIISSFVKRGDLATVREWQEANRFQVRDLCIGLKVALKCREFGLADFFLYRLGIPYSFEKRLLIQAANEKNREVVEFILERGSIIPEDREEALRILNADAG
jgi:hypothetical protein